MSADRRTVLLLVLLAAAGATPSAAQRIRREFGVSAIHRQGERWATSVGIGGALRPSARTRVAAYAGLGPGEDAGGRPVGRFELVSHFLLSPARRQGLGWYAGGGLGLDVTDEARTRIVALLGTEWRPGARSGWVLEAGVGGGWRVAAGWRWRR